jgi:hypothetical protein
MTRTGIVTALFLAIVACKEGRKDDGKVDQKAEAPPIPTFTDNGASAQQRLGSYLQSSVVTPKLRTCWNQLQSGGAVAVDLSYNKSGDNWTLENVKVTKSTLPKGQEATVQRCIEESARATTFPVDSKQELETVATHFIARLGFSVPLPPAGSGMTDAEVARMIGTGGGAGVITVPGCSDCVPNPNYPYGRHCVKKKSGSNVDCEEINSNLCATTTQACASGLFGGTRGVIMF